MKIELHKIPIRKVVVAKVGVSLW